MNSDTLKVAQAIQNAERILIITGAGLSADSGLPTYRGLGGLYNGLTAEGLPIEAALSGPMLQRDPALCWKYLAQLGEYRQVMERVRQAEAIAEALDDDRRRGRVCAVLTNAHAQLGELDEAIAQGERALAIAFIDALQLRLQASVMHLPYQVFLMMPFVLTILAMALVSRRARAPAALLTPFRREER